jgi:hypothetical protein
MIWKNFAFINAFLFYFFVESMYIGIFVWGAWKFLLMPTFNYPISYIQWIIVIWIIKVLRFNTISAVIDINKTIDIKKDADN